MKKYMINICYGDHAEQNKQPTQQEEAASMQKYEEWSEKIAHRTILAHKLKDGEGRRLGLSGSKIKDGPYVETKESIGGFYLINAENYEEACRMAKDCPTLYTGGYVEVREVEF